jgi:hypothetical protein
MRLKALIIGIVALALTACATAVDLTTTATDFRRMEASVVYVSYGYGIGSGVVIAPGPLHEYVPVCTQSTRGSGGDAGDETVLVTQWDMNALEQAGMLKMDFLGLKTLTVIYDAVDAIRQRHGALRDPATGQERSRTDLLERVDAEHPPTLQVDTSRAYVNDVHAGRVHEIDYNDDLRLARTFETEVAPHHMVETGR